MLFQIWLDRELLPLGGEFYLDDEGFRLGLSAPGQRPVSVMTSAPSVVVLGEPGIGKSEALRRMTGSEESCTFLDLGSVADASDFDAVLEGSLGRSDLEKRTLVLDGLDECPIPSKALARHLLSWLRKNRPRRLLVGCRTADWSASLEQALRDLRPDLEVLELLPLARQDVVDLAGSRGVDGQMFLAAVVAAGVVPLSVLPLTLDLLLATYEQAASLPVGAAALYEKGLLLLVAEPDPDREPEKRPPGTPSQRLAAAARLAAYVTLCGRGAIARRPPARDDDLLAGDLAAGLEQIPGGTVDMTAELIEGALNTPLFAGRGVGRAAVVHASLAAYLTARFLNGRAVPQHQVRALLTRTNSLGRTAVPPRLRETAAWMVALDAAHNSWLVDVDPDAIAAHAGLVNVPQVRSDLVQYLLDGDEPDLRTARRRWRLAHPHLAEQLRDALRAPLLADAGPDFGHPVSRRAKVALEIARAAGERRSVPDLLDLVLSASVNCHLRAAAAYAVLDLDADAGRGALRAVLDEVDEHPDRDPYDELRGLALESNWPTALTATELAGFLSHPQKDSYFGSYEMFLGRFLEGVTDSTIADLVRATAPGADRLEDRWVDEDDPGQSGQTTRLPALLTGSRRGARAMTALLNRALGSSALPEVVEPVGWMLAAAVQGHQAVTAPPRFEGTDADEEAKRLRHDLLLAALSRLPSGHGGLLVSRLPWLLRADDLEWLFLDVAKQAAEHASSLIRRVFDITNEHHQELAWRYEGHPIHKEALGHIFTAVGLDSPEAEEMRQAEASRRRHEVAWDGAAHHELSLAVAWERCEKGDPDGFSLLCEALRVDPRSGHPSRSDDIRSWPSRHLLTADDRSLAAVIEQYLELGEVDDTAWFDTPGHLPFRSFVGYAALAFLARLPDGQARLDALSWGVWERWAPAVVRFPMGVGDDAIRGILRAKAARYASQPFYEWLLRSIEVNAGAGWVVDSLDELPEPCDGAAATRLDTALREAVNVMSGAAQAAAAADPSSETGTDVKTRPLDASGRLANARSAVEALARFLASRREETAAWLLRVAEGTNGFAVEVRVVAAVASLAGATMEWRSAFALMQRDETFGSALAHALARLGDDGVPLWRLSADELAQLWRWLNERWSAQSDRWADGPVPWDDPLRRWRDAIVFDLVGRATPDALAALASLAAAQPDDRRLAAALADAEVRDHDENWRGVTVAELTALLDDSRRTLVHDDDALYRAILDSLGRFAARMGENGQSLWNETRPASGTAMSAKVWTPKYEPDISAAVRDHLLQEFRERLIVNREVLVKQTDSKGHGLAVDVLPSSTAADVVGRLPRCPIEVKGSWHPDLFTGLQDQLVADYLPATGANRGIYLCAWFPPDQWDDKDDSRRATAASRDRGATADRLEAEAREASRAGTIEVAALMIDVPRPVRSERAVSKARPRAESGGTANRPTSKD